MMQRWNVCTIDGLRVVCYQAPIYARLCNVAVHDRCCWRPCRASLCLCLDCVAVRGRRGRGCRVTVRISAVAVVVVAWA